MLKGKEIIKRVKQRIEKSRFTGRIYRVLLYLLIAIVMFGICSTLFSKQGWYGWIFDITSSIVGFILAILLSDCLLGIAKFLENSQNNFKAKNMMVSYRKWVINSQFGDSYRVLDYLNDNSRLTELLQDRDGAFREQQKENFKVEEYISDLRYNKIFILYNDVIMELSKKPLTELKNLLSFIELPPKKSWFLALIKTILVFFVPASTFSNIYLIQKFLNEDNNAELITKVMDFFDKIKVFILSNNLIFLIGFLLFILFFLIFIFILMFKDTKFDEPHIREYLKTTITRAIEIKENGE